jgi:hypothetical protein
MPELTKKSKMISIRLSPEEYDTLKTIYLSRGVRSVSELAREAMRKILNGNGPAGTQPHHDLETHVHNLDTKVTVLQGEVSQLSRLLAETLKR